MTMGFDKSFFENTGLQPIRKKYYDKYDVDETLETIRQGYADLAAENETLTAKLRVLTAHIQSLEEENTRRKDEISETLLSTKVISQQMLADADEEAGKVVAAAQEEAAKIIAAARAREEAAAKAEEKLSSITANTKAFEAEALQRYLDMTARMREQHRACIDEINRSLQEFLSTMDDDVLPELPAQEDAPEDLSDRVDAIAKEMFSLLNGDSEE